MKCSAVGIRCHRPHVAHRQDEALDARKTFTPTCDLKQSVNAFDLDCGTDTGGFIGSYFLKTGHPHDDLSTAYHATPPSLFEQIITCWQGFLDFGGISDYTFLDIGAGKGRPSLLASRRGFRNVLGVELNGFLASTASRNIEIFGPKALCTVSVQHADFLTLDFPENALMIYLFNPFNAEAVRLLLEWLGAHKSNHPGPLDIVYVSDEHRSVLAGNIHLRMLWSGDVHLSDEDASAERDMIFEVTHEVYTGECCEPCSVWRWIDRDEVRGS